MATSLRQARGMSVEQGRTIADLGVREEGSHSEESARWARPEFWFEEVSRAETSDRINWLGKIPRKPFLPQPYAQLAGVLHLSGDTGRSKRDREAKIDLEVKEHSRLRLRGNLLEKLVWLFYRPLWAMFRLGFNYGLSPGRASFTVAICLLAGWFATAALDQRGYLVQNTSTTATLMAADASGKLSAAFPHANPPFETRPALRQSD